ncbi:unnamed protein product [Coccothraustes coccothraustes]
MNPNRPLGAGGEEKPPTSSREQGHRDRAGPHGGRAAGAFPPRRLFPPRGAGSGGSPLRVVAGPWPAAPGSLLGSAAPRALRAGERWALRAPGGDNARRARRRRGEAAWLRENPSPLRDASPASAAGRDRGSRINTAEGLKGKAYKRLHKPRGRDGCVHT